MPARPPPWTIEGVAPKTIARAGRMAAEAGLTLGRWSGRVIEEATAETPTEAGPGTGPAGR